MRPATVVIALVTFLLSATTSIARETEKLYRSGHFLGRGYAGLASPDDEDALFYNPAALWQPSQTMEPSVEVQPAASPDEPKSMEQGGDNADTAAGGIEDRPPMPETTDSGGLRKIVILSPLFTASDTANELMDASGDDVKTLVAIRDLVGEPVHAGFDNFSGVLIDNWAVGFVATGRVDMLVYKNPYESGIEAVDMRATQYMGITGGYSYSLLEDQLQLGVTGKLLQKRLTMVDITIADVEVIRNFNPGSHQNTGIGYGLDLGATYHLDLPWKPVVGMQIADLGDTSFKEEKDDRFPVESLKQTINLGVAATTAVPFGEARFFLDIRDLLKRAENNIRKLIHIGADYTYDGFAGFSLGINQGYLTSGIYTVFQYFRFDLGSYCEEAGKRIGERSSRRYYLRLMSTL